MKILHIHTGKDWGGGEHQLLHLLIGLKDGGCDVLLVCARGGAMSERCTKFGIAHEDFSLSKSIALLGPPRAMLECVTRFAPEVLHAHDSLSTTLVSQFSKRLTCPAIMTRRVASPLRRNLLSRLKYSPKRLSAIIAISEAVREEVLKIAYPERCVFVVPDGLDVEALKGTQAIGGLRKAYGAQQLVVGIGTLSVKKDWATLVRVAAALRSEFPHLHWLLAGRGGEQQNLEQLCEALEVSDIVHLLGFRDDADALLLSADALFFPSWLEGASVTVRDAMAMGIPVVAARNAGVVESLAGTGCLFEPQDVGEGAQWLSRILRDSEFRASKVAAAQESARQRFPIQLTIDGTRAVYQHIASGSMGELNDHE